MPILQLHQLRVAAVARIIMNHISEPLDVHTVILACLFHDMGNLIKADLNYFEDACQPEGKDYWLQVKKDFIEKYGPDEKVATEMIARECGLSIHVSSLISGAGFANADKAAFSTLEQKICTYADMRVVPYGVVSLMDRMVEGRERYKNRYPDTPEQQQYFEEKTNFLKDIEQSIQSVCSIPLQDITEKSVQLLIPELQQITI